MSDAAPLSKYAAKKARQAATGEVGYISCAVSSKVTVAVTKAPARQTPEQRKAQSERDKAREAERRAKENAVAAIHLRGFVGRMEDAARDLADTAVSITLARVNAHGEVKGEISSIFGLYGAAVQKVQAALARAKTLLSTMEGGK